MLAWHAGHWDHWTHYHKVTFDGVRRLIIVNPGVTVLDVKVDVYSSWKEWVRLEDYSKYEPALRAVGGDPVGLGMYAGDIYFLINGWKIWVDHEVATTGIIYSDDGTSPFVTPVTANVVRSAASNLALAYGYTPDQVALLASIEERLQQVAKEVTTQAIRDMTTEMYRLLGLERGRPLVVSPSQRTAGAEIEQDILESGGTVTVTRR